MRRTNENRYLEILHQYLPVLAGSKARVDAQISQCPTLLRDIFVEALHYAIQSFPPFPASYTTLDLASISKRIAEWESELTPRTPIVNLVHLQTLILTAIATDNFGPTSVKGGHGGAAKASILGRAVGLAYSMRLHLPQSGLKDDIEIDLDSDENVASRAWWTLVMLDRWNAIGTASPLLIPNDSVVILPSLGLLLGETGYHLAREYSLHFRAK